MGCPHRRLAGAQRARPGRGLAACRVHWRPLRACLRDRSGAARGGGAFRVADLAGGSGRGSAHLGGGAPATRRGGMGWRASAATPSSHLVRASDAAARSRNAIRTPADVWFVAFVAISAVLTMFPLAFIRAFAVSQRLPATTYAFAAAGSLAIYSMAASVPKRRGARLVLKTGLAVRAVATAILAVAFASRMGGEPLALAGLTILVQAWPLLGVSGTALAAELAPGEKGEALGLFNASSSLAGAIGAFLGGWAAEAF